VPGVAGDRARSVGGGVEAQLRHAGDTDDDGPGLAQAGDDLVVAGLRRRGGTRGVADGHDLAGHGHVVLHRDRHAREREGEPGEPADVRELPGLVISKVAVSEMANNAYLLRDPASGEALLIDAAAEPETLRALIGDADVRTVVTTHGHWDHHRALPEIVEA